MAECQIACQSTRPQPGQPVEVSTLDQIANDIGERIGKIDVRVRQPVNAIFQACMRDSLSNDEGAAQFICNASVMVAQVSRFLVGTAISAGINAINRAKRRRRQNQQFWSSVTQAGTALQHDTTKLSHAFRNVICPQTVPSFEIVCAEHHDHEIDRLMCAQTLIQVWTGCSVAVDRVIVDNGAAAQTFLDDPEPGHQLRLQTAWPPDVGAIPIRLARDASPGVRIPETENCFFARGHCALESPVDGASPQTDEGQP
jgi:hypothetical protein